MLSNRDKTDFRAFSLSKQQICDACNSITLDAFVNSESIYRHLPGYQALLSSSENCDLCRLMVQGLRAQFVTNNDGRLGPHDQYTSGALGRLDSAITAEANNESFPVARGWVVLMKGTVRVSHNAQCSLNIFSFPDAVLSNKFINAYMRISDLPKDTRVRGTDLLHSARIICSKNSRSLTATSLDTLPKRVLVLSEDMSSGNLHLQEWSPTTKRPYIALSHRWWSSRHLITTKSNVKKHHQNISFGDLPKTFQDAITVCRFMKIRYLWIDSLCIVQDDSEDWRRESARMGHIYSNAFCTLATHAARDDTEGFLDSTLDCKHGSVLLGGQGGTPQVSVSLRDNFEWHTVWNSSLSTRGWIVQERLLSKQILHFAPSEIFWECESDILSLADNSGKIVSNMTQLPPPLLPRSSLEYKTPGIDTVWWYRTIQWYSRCQLTEEKDKLPAIACIVSHIQRTSTSKYFAGLWDYDIAKGLLWLAVEGVTLRRPQVKRAPSWSWASWDGPIRFLFLNKSTDSNPREDFLTSPRLLDFPEPEQDADVSLETFFKRKVRSEALPGSFPTDEPDSLIETDELETIQISVQLIEVKAGTYEQIGESDVAGLYTWQGYRVLGKVQQPSSWVVLDDETTINLDDRIWFALMGITNGIYVGLLVVRSNIGFDAYRRIGVGGYKTTRFILVTVHGLLVQFPGLILHLPNTMSKEGRFWVMVHQSMHKWFKVITDTQGQGWETFWETKMNVPQDAEPSIIMSVENPHER